MCKINCSGGCPECAPDEHAAAAALEWLEKQEGIKLPDDSFYAISSAIYKEINLYGKK